MNEKIPEQRLFSFMEEERDRIENHISCLLKAKDSKGKIYFDENIRKARDKSMKEKKLDRFHQANLFLRF